MKTNFLKINSIFQPSLFGVLFCFSCLFFLTAPLSVSASVNHNVRGYAKLVNTGSYISLNCFDDAGGGKFPFNFPIQFSIAACEVNDHGVNIDSFGNFSGSAWHYIYGDINFETSTSSPIEVPDETFRNNCPTSTDTGLTYCTSVSGCSACLVRNTDGTPGNIYGYARVAGFVGNQSEGDGWIKLDGLTVDSFEAGDSAGSFHGAVSDKNSPASVGAIKFNCLDDNTCASDPDNLNWKTYIWSLWVGEMSAPNWGYSNACAGDALGAGLKWKLTSGKQKRWEIIVSENDVLDTNNPSFYATGYDGGSHGVGSYNCRSTIENCGLNYDKSYNWWLKLWYSINENDSEVDWQSTPWLRFDHTATSSIGKLVPSFSEFTSEYNFTTFKNEFPRFWYDTSATPTPLIVGSSSEFMAYAEYTNPTEPNTYYDCEPGNCRYLWSSDDNSAKFSPKESEFPNTQIIFQRPTGTTITVQVTDKNGYYCDKTTNAVNANFSMPLWKEIKVKKNAK
ncbi:MAG: hypothetical protein ACOYMB_01155 [Patescibacteria group bacterium]